MSTKPLELDYKGLSKTSSPENYPCLKTELSLSLPGSEPSNPALELSLFGPETQANVYAFNSVKCNNNSGGSSRGFTGKRGLADASGKWNLSANGGSECEVGKGATLFSHGAGKKPAKLTDMDIDKRLVSQNSLSEKKPENEPDNTFAAKAQVVGWPPIRSFRKNSMASANTKNSAEGDAKSGPTCLYVKVSMDGAAYLRKVDLKLYKEYLDLSIALKKMFSCFSVGKDWPSDSHMSDLLHGSECVLTYQDKDGDWMLVGDVPWDMFTSTCHRLRIMRGSEAIGLGPSEV
ncbi:unnamed protein product [Rhodiola kirilowii]